MSPRKSSIGRKPVRAKLANNNNTNPCASHSRASKAALVIPRAKVTPSRGYNNSGYHSDEDRFSGQQERNRAVSEVESQGSRHRRRSVPSFASSLLGGRGRRAGAPRVRDPWISMGVFGSIIGFL